MIKIVATGGEAVRGSRWGGDGPGLNVPARIVWSAALGMVVGAVASLAAMGFVNLVLLLDVWLVLGHHRRRAGQHPHRERAEHPEEVARQ